MGKYLAIYGKPRYLGIFEYGGEVERGAAIVAETHRGEEIAYVAGALSDEQEQEYRQMRNVSEYGDSAVKNGEPVVVDLTLIEPATEDDIDNADGYRLEENEILRRGRELLIPHKLEMKLIDVEFIKDKKKLFFYFSSEQRVDFRGYVRDLAREFKTRIELRQIGVRDEAKVIKGIGPCGNPCCCSYWLNQFAPIGIKMVKEQNLALNPTKISGICGRLMCCMCFEHNIYKEMWQGLPNPGSKIKTPNGSVIVSGVELHTKSVRCCIPGRGEVKVPVSEFERFRETVLAGGEWAVREDESAAKKISGDIAGFTSPFAAPPAEDEPEPGGGRREAYAAEPSEQPKHKKKHRSKKPPKAPGEAYIKGAHEAYARPPRAREGDESAKKENRHIRKRRRRYPKRRNGELRGEEDAGSSQKRAFSDER